MKLGERHQVLGPSIDVERLDGAKRRDEVPHDFACDADKCQSWRPPGNDRRASIRILCPWEGAATEENGVYMSSADPRAIEMETRCQRWA